MRRSCLWLLPAVCGTLLILISPTPAVAGGAECPPGTTRYHDTYAGPAEKDVTVEGVVDYRLYDRTVAWKPIHGFRVVRVDLGTQTEGWLAGKPRVVDGEQQYVSPQPFTEVAFCVAAPAKPSLGRMLLWPLIITGSGIVLTAAALGFAWLKRRKGAS